LLAKPTFLEETKNITLRRKKSAVFKVRKCQTLKEVEKTGSKDKSICRFYVKNSIGNDKSRTQRIGQCVEMNQSSKNKAEGGGLS